MYGQLVLVAGLPGSGKTSYLCKKQKEGFLTFDDFKIDTDALKFCTSPRFPILIAAVSEGRKCVVADIDFCDLKARNEAEQELRSAVPGIELEWIYFENDVASCELNIRNRNRACFAQELGYLKKYSGSYQIPPGAKAIPVWQARRTDSWQLGAENCP